MPPRPLTRLFAETLSFRARIFNTLACIGIAIGIIIGVFGALNRAGLPNVLVSFAASAFALALLRYANGAVPQGESDEPGENGESGEPGEPNELSENRFRLCFMITVVAVFLIAFPYLFFTAGGLFSGMPAFFVFAVTFTAFMLEGKKRAVMATLEIALYFAIGLIAYRFPETVAAFPTTESAARDIIGGGLVASASLAASVGLHTAIYDKKQRQLERLNRAKTEFLGNVSHELATPLTVISGYAQYSNLILDGENPDISELRDNMRGIISEAERTDRLVAQLLDASAIESGVMTIIRRPLSFADIAEKVRDVHFPIINTKNNTLSLNIPDTLPQLNADRDRLLQVLVNLVSNAAHHTENGHIEIAAREENGAIAVTVTDTGEGIAEETRANLFDRYLSAKPGLATHTGLGLYICKKIIAAHGGELGIENGERRIENLKGEGSGTAVTFTLPIQAGR